MEEDENSDDTLSNSPPRKTQFLEDYDEDDEEYSDEIEKNFHEDEDMDEGTE